MDIIYNEETGKFEKYKEPYATIDVETEKDFKELKEILKAKEESRLVVLPCRVGDKVWFIKCVFSYSKQPIPAMVCGLKTFSSTGTFTFMALTDENNINRSFINQDIGKTVFLTREEAEAKLKEMQEDE